MAGDIKPDLLLLNHVLIWGNMSENDLLEEIEAGYDGKVVIGRELAIY